jgi:hypothetical protein
MFLTLILIALFPLSGAEQNEINPKNEEKLFERLRGFFFAKKQPINPGVAPPAVALLFLLAQNE